ncbi:RNA ligase family protein [Mariniblastus fucicola]|uniref:RNA ligase n=1 Tax=Mariniblastus fucicola TaxID=980251 RepID=A0A5B9PKL7_9BACT|nr:RNA ligase family protein [Mariniblastus fucicola]QEG25262.1 RNA ligase [Mariniblastus fucicola]
MGTSHGDFVKYPRTPHIAGSTGTSDDKRLGADDTEKILSDPSLIVEEKLDGTNVGLHFSDGELVLQCRGHEITAGMHPQYDLFKQWATVKRNTFEEMLGEQFIIYGEWMYATHCIHYQELPHYFFEFDIYDKSDDKFLTLEARLDLLHDTGIETVPVVHRGELSFDELLELVVSSPFGASLEHPTTGEIDDLVEGLYLRTEDDAKVTSRAKYVRPEFIEKIKQSQHWQYERMIPNELTENADIWK